MKLKEGYKQTEIGVIPEDWEVAPLSREIDRLEAGVSVNSVNVELSNYSDDLCVLKTSAVSNGQFFPSESKKIASQDISRAKLNPRKDTILISRMNTPDLVGECGYVATDYSNLFIPDRLWMAQSRNRSGICVKWLNFLLSSKPCKSRIKGSATGTSGSMKNIAKQSFLAMLIPYPRSTEQHRIATVLAEMDDFIIALDKIIAKKCDLRQATIQELISSKGIGRVQLLQEISSLKGRIGWQGLKQTEFTTNEDEPFLITGMNFKDGAIRWDEVYHIPEERYEIAKDIQLKTDDVLMTKDGTIGKMLYIDQIPPPGRASLNSHLLLFRPLRGGYVPKYLYYQLTSKRFKDFIELNKSGTTFFGISQAAVGRYPVLLPSIEEQTLIAVTLSDMDSEIAALEERRDKTHALKQGMMQNLLTGKIRLV